MAKRNITKARAVKIGKTLAELTNQGIVSDREARAYLRDFAATLQYQAARLRDLSTGFASALQPIGKRVNPAPRRSSSRRRSAPSSSSRPYVARFANGKRLQFNARSDEAARRYARGLGAARAGSAPTSLRRSTAAAPKKKVTRRRRIAR